jgi:hypothetical protein
MIDVFEINTQTSKTYEKQKLETERTNINQMYKKNLIIKI